jgi:hypothetical protein
MDGQLVHAWLAGGRVVDLALVLLLAEGLLLTWLYRRQQLGVAPAALWPVLAAGTCLLLALRAALTGAVWPWVPGWLSLALLAHLLDLRRRWRVPS